MSAVNILHAALILTGLLLQTVIAEDNLYRVMSFNIRFGTADDGPNRWPLRQELVASTIRQFSPDLIGAQEIMPFQAEYLTRQLEDYTYVGKLREPDKEDGEQCGVFFRRDRFVDLTQGHFWLSATPELPGSKSWDSSLPRMVTWVKLFDRRNNAILYLFNTHFDHRGGEARRESAMVLRDHIRDIAGDAAVIVTGDFNCAEGSEPHRVLVTHNKGAVSLTDTYRAHHPTRQPDEGTFNGFSGRASGGRIDWILTSPQLQVQSAAIVTDHQNGRYPSDHFPVTAVLRRAQ